MRAEKIQESVVLPQGVSATGENHTLTIKGPKGEVKRVLFHPKVALEVAPTTITLTAVKPNKEIKMVLYTLLAHARNMVQGAAQGFTYKLKICYVHFPMTVKVEGSTVVISNFLGEKIPRKSRILENVKVKVEGEIIVVEGADLEKVSQTAANIEMTTRITRRDRRRFQDGCYIIEKAGVPV
ncbi:MAG: 50S ribosomal protein L6 [Nanoarchaeota archaeon]